MEPLNSEKTRKDVFKIGSNIHFVFDDDAHDESGVAVVKNGESSIIKDDEEKNRKDEKKDEKMDQKNSIAPTPPPILFKVNAQKGPKNVAQAQKMHGVVWRIDAKGKAVLKNMKNVFVKDAVGTDAFVAPRDGQYQVMVFANWKGSRDLGVGKTEMVAIPAEIYVQWVPFSSASIDSFHYQGHQGHQHIGRGNAGVMYDLKAGDKLFFFLKNKNTGPIQVDSDNTFLHIGCVC